MMARCCHFSGYRRKGLLDRDRKDGALSHWLDRGSAGNDTGKAINFRAIIRRLAEINTEYALERVAYDRAFIKTFKAQCDEEGIILPLEEFGQGYVSMSPAVQALEAASSIDEFTMAGTRSCAGK